MSTVIHGGTIIDASGQQQADVLIGDDGRIEAVAQNLSGDHHLDASGCIVSPGFVDLHSHLREPGQEVPKPLKPAPEVAPSAATPLWSPCPTPPQPPTALR